MMGISGISCWVSVDCFLVVWFGEFDVEGGMCGGSVWRSVLVVGGLGVGVYLELGFGFGYME